MNKLLLQASQIIDGTGQEPIADGAILVDGDRIQSIGQQSQISRRNVKPDQILDLSGWTVLPGLIDAHTHLDGWESNNRLDWVIMPDTVRVLNAAAYAKRMLDAGFTFVRDAGSTVAVALKQAIQAGKLPGPRMLVSYQGIYQTNGQGDRAYLPIEWVKQTENCILVDGPVECRRAVRLMLRAGADFIKVATSGGYLSSEPHFTLEEVEAVCDEAHRMGKRVAAHALGEEGIRTALLGGVDSIEHGAFLTPDLARLMAERDIPLVPTLSIGRRYLECKNEFPLSPDAEFKWQETRTGAEESVRLAKEYGVRIAVGTDFGGQPILPPDELSVELQYLVEAGLDPHEAIMSATRIASEVLGVSDEVGTLTQGKLADIIAVPGDPLKEIGVLRQVGLVIKGGQVVHADGLTQ